MTSDHRRAVHDRRSSLPHRDTPFYLPPTPAAGILSSMSVHSVHRTLDAVWRMDSPRIIASLARIVGDVGVAEELAQEALLAALEQWPSEGIPDNAGGWLMATARHRALDHFRRSARIGRKHEELAHSLEAAAGQAVEALEVLPDTVVADDLLRLMFVSCHPILSTDARIALTLRLLGGLTTAEIARAFLQSESTIAQRIVRAKRTLASAGVPFEVPHKEELDARLSSVLEVIYLIFNEGYSATSGSDWMRPGLCEDALRLVRILAELTPREPEVHGLAALLELQASRTRARVNHSGEPILLLDQNRALWDRLLIHRGLVSLSKAERLSSSPGPYALQAAIAACHARAVEPHLTDWSRIAALYGVLATVLPSPVVELNRAVAVGMAEGPQAGLEWMDTLLSEPLLREYPYLFSARGEMLFRSGRLEEASQAFERAAELSHNARERSVLLARALSCRTGSLT